MDEKTKEANIQEAVKAFEKSVRENADKFKDADDRLELDINKIEAFWSDNRRSADAILKQFFTKMSQALNETDSELIRKKKRN
jgi:hypothetical protein